MREWLKLQHRRANVFCSGAWTEYAALKNSLVRKKGLLPWKSSQNSNSSKHLIKEGLNSQSECISTHPAWNYFWDVLFWEIQSEQVPYICRYFGENALLVCGWALHETVCLFGFCICTTSTRAEEGWFTVSWYWKQWKRGRSGWLSLFVPSVGISRTFSRPRHSSSDSQWSELQTLEIPSMPLQRHRD